MKGSTKAVYKRNHFLVSFLRTEMTHCHIVPWFMMDICLIDHLRKFRQNGFLKMYNVHALVLFQRQRCQFRIRLIQEKTFATESISPYHSRYSWKHKIETFPRTNISSFWLVGWGCSETHPFSHIFMDFFSLTYRLESVRPPTRPLLGCSRAFTKETAKELARWHHERLS